MEVSFVLSCQISDRRTRSTECSRHTLSLPVDTPKLVARGVHFIWSALVLAPYAARLEPWKSITTDISQREKSDLPIVSRRETRFSAGFQPSS
jgi:hypothetical protein